MSKKVAWVSRHPPLPIQLRTLKEKLGEFELKMISKTFRDAKEVYEEIKDCDYAVVVLPLSMIMQLFMYTRLSNITLLWAEMEGLHECKIDECKEFNEESDVWLPLRGSEKGRHMRFKSFKVIKEVRMVLEEW